MAKISQHLKAIDMQNEEKVKAAVLKLQRQVDQIPDKSGKGIGVLITVDEAKALIDLWNWHQMMKPNDFDHYRNRRR